MKRHCGRLIGGRGEGYAKSGQMRTRGEGGGKKWYFLCGRPLWMAPYSLLSDFISGVNKGLGSNAMARDNITGIYFSFIYNLLLFNILNRGTNLQSSLGDGVIKFASKTSFWTFFTHIPGSN